MKKECEWGDAAGNLVLCYIKFDIDIAVHEELAKYTFIRDILENLKQTLQIF